MAEAGRQPRLADVIEDLGMGPHAVKQMVSGGAVWLAEGAQLLLIGSVAKSLSLSREWGELEGVQKGALASVTYLGALAGNFVGGNSSDVCGRRPSLLAAYALLFLSGVLAAMAKGFWSLSVAMFCVGLAFGIGQPAWTSLFNESTPINWRMTVSVISQTGFLIGEAYVALLIWLDDPFMVDLHWKRLLLLGALPGAIFGIVSAGLLDESPSWLAIRGRLQEAHKVLESFRWWNGKESVCVDFAPPEAPAGNAADPGARGRLRVIFGPVLRFSTLVTCFTCVNLNFLYFGCLYVLPQVVSEARFGMSPAATLLLGVAWEFPGFAGAIVCGNILDRRPAQFLYLCVSVISVLLFVVGGQAKLNAHAAHAGRQWMLHVGYAGMKSCPSLGFGLVYQYAAELYPTSSRALGTAICLAVGRLGAIAAPVFFEKVTEVSGSWTTFFYIVANALAVNAVLVLFLPFETKGNAMKDHIEDIATAGPSTPLVTQTTPAVGGPARKSSQWAQERW